MCPEPSVHPHKALATILTRVAGSMTAQEVANVMYALAILTYDTAVSIPIYSEKGAKNKNMESETKTKTKLQTKGITSHNHTTDTNDIEILGGIYSTILQEFKRIDPKESSLTH